MRIVVIHKKKDWTARELNVSISVPHASWCANADSAGSVGTFGSLETVHFDQYDAPPGGNRCWLVFVHANDTDRWGPMDDNLAASEIESYFAARGPALLGVLPITTSDGNAGNKGDVVYGARAIRRLFDAIASGADFTDLEAVRKCLEPETASSSDLANALAILCQGYLAAAVSMKLDSIMDADVQRALVLIGHSRELFIDPAKAQEVLSPRWWKSPFSERPSIKSGPAGEIDRLLSAIWDEEDPESASIELSTVVGAYLELIG